MKEVMQFSWSDKDEKTIDKLYQHIAEYRFKNAEKIISEIIPTEGNNNV
ncbi:MAG: hypothetical protein GY865_17325 [candidate division Zixibacteria bacterium]|nr:hypothetical protein [candidate division Zixibacteria bacterium]